MNELRKRCAVDISLKMLQYFKKVAETQHITNASKELYISQPQLTRVIAELERELGVTLFDREGKGIRLNPCGEAFYRYTDQDLRDKRPDEQKNGKIDSQTKEYGFALGGPIIQDRMHFFVAYEGKDNIAPKSIQADANAGSYTGFLNLPPENGRQEAVGQAACFSFLA
jgi:hypothetical protein